MNNYFDTTIIWAQVDANGHLRHSAYADIAAQGRIALLAEAGISYQLLQQLHLGPVLFREESVYLREVGMNEKVRITTEITRCRPDGSRWSFVQELFREDGIKAAIIRTDGAWIDTETKKLTTLGDRWADAFTNVPRSADFTWDIKA